MILRPERTAVRSFFSISQQGGRRPALFFWLASLALALALAAPPTVAAAPAIVWRTEAAPRVAVEVTALPAPVLAALEHADLAELGPLIFPVFADGGGAAATAAAGNTGGMGTEPALSLPPMLGSWRVAEGSLRFEPRFPLDRGMTYRAEFRPAQLAGLRVDAAAISPLRASFALPAPDLTPVTSVAQIYPTAAVLPENQLKFYVYFSASMSGGDIYQHIHLRDAAGQKIDLPFLELAEELWNQDLTRVTLLIDPGRIKRGVMPLEDIGPVFEAGKSYSLTIDAAWRDAQRRPLRAGFRKDFRIGPADRTPPDPARWTVRAPAAGTREPLVVAFDEPMDHALATRMIGVITATGTVLEGEVTLTDDDRRWSFAPAQPWTQGTHTLVIPTTIEDLAGNNIGKPFDVDLFERVDRTFTTTSAKLPFEVK